MQIAHRINTIEEIKCLPENVAIEFDVRDSGTDLIVQHDPYNLGVKFEEFLPYLKHRFFIVNIKSEGIEPRILKGLEDCCIETFFLLDCTIPMIYKLTSLGEKKIAVRMSEFETLDSVLKWKNRVEWVWIDCFYSYILTKEVEELLHCNGFKICIVSPELQGRNEDISLYKDVLVKNNISIDAVCTKYKNFGLWS